MSSILLTCRDKDRLQKYYIPAVRRGGWDQGLTLLAPGDAVPSLEGQSGLLIVGGDDIHPKYWDPVEPLHPAAEVDEGRDTLEGPLAREAWRLGIPILGICRGEQMLNVALGGSLIQDIPSWFGCPSEIHRSEETLAHRVQVEPTSRLARLLGCESCSVNSRHHQAVRQVAPGFRASAWHPETSRDGEPLVEAIESCDPDRWALGVQWHPENLVDLEDGVGFAARRIFEAFAEAARAR